MIPGQGVVLKVVQLGILTGHFQAARDCFDKSRVSLRAAVPVVVKQKEIHADIALYQLPCQIPMIIFIHVVVRVPGQKPIVVEDVGIPDANFHGDFCAERKPMH